MSGNGSLRSRRRRVITAAGLVGLLAIALSACVPIPRFTLTNGQWRLRNANSAGSPNLSFAYAGANHIPVSGDWNADGVETIGTFIESNRTWFLRNSNSAGNANTTFVFGPVVTSVGDGYPTLIPVVGDWNGDGRDTVGVFDRGTGTWYLRNTNTTGGSIGPFRYGSRGDIPVVGDWDGNGTDTVGVARGAVVDNQAFVRWHLRNSNTAGTASIAPFNFGPNGVPMPGDWNGDGTDTPGVYEVLTGRWTFRNANSAGGASITPFLYTGGLADNAAVVVGDWNGDRRDTVGRAT